jgi:L-ascorbate metabolism protein UlaG (beta-lactamase superfamily)
MSANIHYLGHSTILIETTGVNLITDPVFRKRIFHITRTRPVFQPKETYELHAVLISHLHYDHLDIHSLKKLTENPLVLIPKGAGKLLEKNGIAPFQEIQIGDQVEIGSVKIRATYADHLNGRGPLGAKGDCMGYLIEGETSIYFPGDTLLFPGMAEISNDLDIALMPVWGWGPDLGGKHMTPIQAADALTLLKPKLAIPIHWGTYLPMGMAWMKPAFHYMPPKIFSDHAHKVAPQVDVKILDPGESITYP